MVTAIVIPIICIYFLWITRREMKQQDLKWLRAGTVAHEAVLTGEIKDIVEEKQRYYYHRYIYVQELKLQSDYKLVTVRKITPLTKNLITDQFKIGETIRVYGIWDGSNFIFNQFEKVKNKKGENDE